MHRDPVYLIFLPQGLGRVKRLTLPRPLITFAMGLLLFCTLPISYVLFDYWSAKQIEGQLAQMETENLEQRARLMHMAGKIVLLADRLAESEALTVHERPITGIREALKSVSTREEKPERPAALVSDLLASAQYENMVRQMHEGLDYLNAEINALALLRDGDTFKLALHTGESTEKEISGKKAEKAFRRTIIKSRLRTIARELGLAPRLALGMAQVESGFDHGAVSPRGAIGVMQVMPQLAGERFEVEPDMLFDPEVNIRVGLLHMKYLLDRFNDNLDLSLAAYNAGARRVVLAGYRVPHISETREYVKKVKQAMNDHVAPNTWEE
jgi:soluble lytic murein transglycosylase-like protein